MDSAEPLRCFVAGQFVGELTLAACAKRNGVATDALDVGLDANGALAAADQARRGTLTPLPPPAGGHAPPSRKPRRRPRRRAGDADQRRRHAGACWRYEQAQWRKLPTDVPLGACVQTLFAGRCEKPGGATYGRYGQQTLRLVIGKVEISGDNHSFRALAEQGARLRDPTDRADALASGAGFV